MRIRSLRLKLIVAYIGVILLAFGLAAFFLVRSLEENSLNRLKASLYSQAQLIEAQFSAPSVALGDLPALTALTKELSLKTGSRITIVAFNGKVLADSEKALGEAMQMDNHASRPEIRLALESGRGEEIRYSSTLKKNMLYVAVPLRKGDDITGAVRVSLPLDDVRLMLREVARVVLFGIISALVLALVLSTLITTQITGPLDKIIQASKRFASGDFGHKIYHDSRDEIGELADTLNKIAADIEEKIRATVNQSQQLKAIFNSMIEGVILTEASGRIISVNQAIERIFQIVKEGAQGRPLMEAIRNNEIAEVVASVLKSGKQVSKEIPLVYPVQGVFEVNASPIFYGKEISGCLAVIHDITGIRRLETMRRDFVANVSHELKTPLTSIKGFVETLLAGALEDKENNRNFLKIIEGHAERLDHLVNDLLSLSYLESKGITISKESYDLTAQARDVALGFKSQLKKKGIIIANKMPDGLTVCADRARIEQVLVNLLDNAIKFNREKGTIVLRAEDTGSQVKVEIEDSGLGIPARDLARIFERFYRVDKARSRELGGTGLGLSIVKHIVELHGGSVGVESTEGLGSKFRFILPK